MGGPGTCERIRASAPSGVAVAGTTAAETYADPIERRIGRGSSIAVGLAALALTLLTFADCSGSASRAVLPVTDIDDIAIEQSDLPGISLRSSSRTFKAHGEEGYVSLSYDTDATVTGSEKYPSHIEQSIHYNSDAGHARWHLDFERLLGTRSIDRRLTGTPDRADVPVRPGRREQHVVRATDGSTVVYELDYILNNISIYTVLSGRPDRLTAERALEISDITLNKYDRLVRQRTLFLQEEYEDWRFETIVDPLVRVCVPLVGFVLFLLFFPSDSKRFVVQITAGLGSVSLAALYAFLLWKSITISGYGDVVRFEVDGWGGVLTLGLTALLAVMGARLLWRRPIPVHGRRVGVGPSFSTSCPRCKQVSRRLSDRCEYCSLEFRGRA